MRNAESEFERQSRTMVRWLVAALVIGTVSMAGTVIWNTYADNQLKADCQRNGKAWVSNTCVPFCLLSVRGGE